MEPPKTRMLIDPESFLTWLKEEPNFLTWLKEEPNGAREVLGLGSEAFNQMVELFELLFDDYHKWIYKFINEAGLIDDQIADVFQFPVKKSNPFKLVVDNTKEK